MLKITNGCPLNDNDGLVILINPINYLCDIKYKQLTNNQTQNFSTSILLSKININMKV